MSSPEIIRIKSHRENWTVKDAHDAIQKMKDIYGGDHYDTTEKRRGKTKLIEFKAIFKIIED